MNWTVHPADMLAGTKLLTMRGYSTVLPDIDFETYSEAGYLWDATSNSWTCLPGAPQDGKGLGVVGAAVYAKHPSTEVLSLAYNLKDGSGRKLWLPGMPAPMDLLQHVVQGGYLEAHNSTFEHWIWNHVCTRLYGWPRLPRAQLRCSMAKARYNAYPGALAPLGKVLNLLVQKDKGGTDLLKKFSMPRNPTKKDPSRRIRPQDDPVDAERLYNYNDTDIISESEASAHLPDMEGEELEFWLLDQEINYRGVQVDVQSVQAMCIIIDQCLSEADAELYALTGGQVERSSQLERLKGWLAGHGVKGRQKMNNKGQMTESLDDEAITEMLKGELPKPARRALEIRQLSGSASVKKAFAIRNQMTDEGRLHDLFNYHAARSGRPTGEGPQPTNMPKAGPKVVQHFCGRWHGVHVTRCPWCGGPAHPKPKIEEWTWEATHDAIEVIKTGSLGLVRAIFGDAMLTVSGCMRGMLVAKEGHDLICSDFSAIEGVVIAALAGEEWRLEIFRTHGMIYEASASKICGIPFQEFVDHKATTGKHHPMRGKIGKYAELGSGFGGWIGAWKNFGADEFLSDEEIKDGIIKWRDASPAIVEFWGGQGRGKPWSKKDWKPELFGLEGMAISAVQNPGVPFAYRDTTYLYQDDILYCYLISGRCMKYHRPRLQTVNRFENGPDQLQMSYEGWNTNTKNGPPGWIRMTIYGGKFAENVVQAVARDIQRFAMINLNKAGYKIVLHVYDEDVAEVPQGFGSVEEFERIMMTLPDWCRGWPIKAKGGWRGPRYRKD